MTKVEELLPEDARAYDIANKFQGDCRGYLTPDEQLLVCRQFVKIVGRLNRALAEPAIKGCPHGEIGPAFCKECRRDEAQMRYYEDGEPAGHNKHRVCPDEDGQCQFGDNGDCPKLNYPAGGEPYAYDIDWQGSDPPQPILTKDPDDIATARKHHFPMTPLYTRPAEDARDAKRLAHAMLAGDDSKEILVLAKKITELP